MARKIILITAKFISVLLVLWWAFFVFASHGFSEVLLIEMIVPLTILLAALVAWKLPKTGGLLFIGLGLLYIYIAWGRAIIPAIVTFSGPMFLVGLLFLIGGRKWR